MRSFLRTYSSPLLVLAVSSVLALPPSSVGQSLKRVSLQQSPPQVTVREVKVLGAGGSVEIEVETSDRITPEAQMLKSPDRLVLDFPNAVPGNALRSRSVDLGDVKDLRFGLFQAKPPVTRLVLDLKSAQSYQIFPYARTVMIKMTGGSGPSPAVAAANAGMIIHPPSAPVDSPSQTAVAQPAAPLRPPLEVAFRDGLLRVHADKVTLAEIMRMVQQRTGAQIVLAPGVEQEIVVTDLGPAPAQEVLARLLNGSRFNFLILNSATDEKKLDRVILTLRTEGGVVVPLPPVQNGDDPPADENPSQGTPDPNAGPLQQPDVPRPRPEVNSMPNDDASNQ